MVNKSTFFLILVLILLLSNWLTEYADVRYYPNFSVLPILLKERKKKDRNKLRNNYYVSLIGIC